jgi:ABC-type nitrate/sulfonate/bicarbonate transport system substrate-binding protein
MDSKVDIKHFRAKIYSGIVVFLVLAFLTLPVAAAESKKVTFGFSSIGPMMHGLWMAKEIGAFEKHGLEAELIFIASGPVVIQALLGGDLQAGLAATSAVIGAASKGAAVVAVANTASRPYHRLWVQPDINRVEDLKGKTLGITRFGSLPHNLTMILLRKYGLVNAVNIRQFGDTLGIAAAFEQRVVAGAVTSELRVRVPVKVLVNLVDLGIPYSTNVIAVNRDYFRRFPKTVEAMVRAYTDGVAALKNDRNKGLKVVAQYSRFTDPKFVESQYGDSSSYLDRVPRVERAAVAPILEFIEQKELPLETFADNSIIDRMVAEGYIERLYPKN